MGDVVESPVVVEVGAGDVARHDRHPVGQGPRRIGVGEARQPGRDPAAAGFGIGRAHEAAPGVAVAGGQGVMQDGAADQPRRAGQKNRAHVPRSRHGADIRPRHVIHKGAVRRRRDFDRSCRPTDMPTRSCRVTPRATGRRVGQAAAVSPRNSGTL